MSVIIRELKARDWPSVKEIYQKGLDTGMASFETQAPSWEKWDAAHLDIGRILVQGPLEIMGWVALSPVSAREVYRGVAEVSIYIDPKYARKGLGYILFEKLIKESEKAGLWTLQSGIFRQNTASIKLHEKMGFRMIGYREKVAKRDGVWQDNMLMERRSKVVGLE